MVSIKTCPLRPEERGTERPLQNHVAILRVALVEAARFLGGQLFVSFVNEFDLLRWTTPLDSGFASVVLNGKGAHAH
jgi:hypothetical protein